MVYCRLEGSFRSHPKIRKLAKALGIRRPEARGYVTALWSWVVDYTPDGDLSKFDPEDIEYEVEWDGPDGALVAAMEEVQLLDRTEYGLVVHGWMKRAESFRNARRMREARAKERDERKRNSSARVLHGSEQFGSRAEMFRREERRGEEKEKRREEPPQSPPAGGVAPGPKAKSKNTEAIAEVYAHWRSYHPRAPTRLKAASPDARKIRQRLDDGATVELLKAAIDGCHRTPHNLGQNERGTKYLGLNVIMRDTSQVTRFAETAEGPPPRASPQAPTNGQIPSPRLKEIPEPEWIKLKRERDAERARKEPGRGHR